VVTYPSPIEPNRKTKSEQEAGRMASVSDFYTTTRPDNFCDKNLNAIIAANNGLVLNFSRGGEAIEIALTPDESERIYMCYIALLQNSEDTGDIAS
jgi:hypothetical protein